MSFQYEVNALQGFGPIINTYITITDEHKKLLEQSELPIPEPIRCRFLIDTGAYKTLVKHDIAEKSAIKLISTINPIQGIGVDTSGKSYIGRILFICESKRVPGAKHNIYVDTEIASGTLNDNKFIDGLIGRDVLQHFEIRYNGKTGKVVLVYQKK
jgi:predicted aspartyl protease